MPIYTDTSRIHSRLPMIGSLAISAGDMGNFINDAEAIVNGKIVRNYAVPVGSAVPLITAVTTDIAAYLILSRRIFAKERVNDSVWPDRYKEAIDTLEEIAKGDTLLVDSSGTLLETRTDVAEVDSTSRQYVPTFSELPNESSVVDPDKRDDLSEERGWGSLRDRLT